MIIVPVQSLSTLSSMPAHDYCLLFIKQQSIASYLCEQRWRNCLSSSFFRIFAQVDQTDLFCVVIGVKTNLIRPMAVPTPMAVQVETSTASNPRWETHLSVRNSPGNRGWGEKIRTYLTVRMTLTKPKRWSWATTFQRDFSEWNNHESTPVVPHRLQWTRVSSWPKIASWNCTWGIAQTRAIAQEFGFFRSWIAPGRNGRRASWTEVCVKSKIVGLPLHC